jgi:hypothetical protein
MKICENGTIIFNVQLNRLCVGLGAQVLKA